MMDGRKSKCSGLFQFLTGAGIFIFAICKYNDHNLSSTNFWINSDEEVLACGLSLPDSSRFYRRHHYTAKGFLGSRLSFYSNSTASFQQAHLLISGDVSVNPGPDKVHSTNSSTTLRIFYQNARSIKSGAKLCEFQDLGYANNFDIIAISETWLNCEVLESEILPWSYDVHPCDRADVQGNHSTSGGGVLLASRCNLRCQPVFFDMENDLEYAAIEIINNNCGKTLISVFYRPPNASNAWIHQFVDFIDSCMYEKVIIVGDFNLPDINWVQGSGLIDSSPTLSTFCEKLIDKNIFQLIEQPTRGNNTLDLLLSSFVEGVANVQLCDSDGVALSSDHKALTFDLHMSYKFLSPNRQPTYNFKKADFNGLRSKLRESPLPDDFSEEQVIDINSIWSYWKNALSANVDAFIPKRKPKKFLSPPWIDGEATHAIRKKNFTRKKALCNNSDGLWQSTVNCVETSST